MRLGIFLAALAVFTGPCVSLFGDDFVDPMIDYTHDRVQATLDPGLKRIGKVKPRGAKEVGHSNLVSGC